MTLNIKERIIDGLKAAWIVLGIIAIVVALIGFVVVCFLKFGTVALVLIPLLIAFTGAWWTIYEQLQTDRKWRNGGNQK